MKKFLLFVLLLIVLIGGGIVALPMLVPIEKIEAEAKTYFREATGREIAFSRPRFMLFPNIGVELRDVSISNPGWAKEKNLLALESADVRLALKPLLEKKVEIKRFVLKKAVIHLEVAKDGRTSWDFSRVSRSSQKPAAAAQSSAAGEVPFDMKLGAFDIADARVTYLDAAKGASYTVENVDISLVMPDLKSALHLDGSLDYKGKQINIVLGIDQPMELADGKPSKGQLEVRTEDIVAKVSGQMATKGVMLKGDIDAAISSLPGLLSWVQGTKQEGLPFTKITFKSGADVSADELKLSGASLALDDINAGGDVSIRYGGDKPEIYARLSMDKINLDRFTSETTPSASAAGGSGDNSTAAVKTDWDDTLIDLSGLKAVNADLILQTKGFSLRGADVGASNLVVLLKDGNLNFKSSEASLFDGKFSSTLGINAAPVTPTMAFDFKMDGVQAKPVLTTFADFKNLSGAADANVSVTSSGKSQKQIISALNGKGAVTFRDGSVDGIDLVNIAKMIQSKLTDMNIGEGKTDFVALGGTFTIANGIVANNDLKMKGPLVQASGAGTVDLPSKFVQYRVTPVLTASSNADNATGIAVPVDIKGPFHAIKIKPDYAGMLRDALQDSSKIKGTLKNLEDQVEPMKDSIKGGIKDLKNFKKDPDKALQGLMGIIGGQPPAPAPVPAPAPAP